MNIQKELIKYQSETAKRFSMKIPLSKLKEYVETLEALSFDEPEIQTNNNNDIPEIYRLFISEQYELVATEVDSVEKQARYVSAKVKLQPVKAATLMLNKHI